MPLLREPVGGRSVKSLDGGIKEKQPRGWIQVQSLKPPDWISWTTFSSDPETNSGLGATFPVGGITPCWPLTVQVTNWRHKESDYRHVALGLEEESLQGAPQEPGDLPPAKSSPTSEGAWEKGRRK